MERMNLDNCALLADFSLLGTDLARHATARVVERQRQVKRGKERQQREKRDSQSVSSSRAALNLAH